MSGKREPLGEKKINEMTSQFRELNQEPQMKRPRMAKENAPPGEKLRRVLSIPVLEKKEDLMKRANLCNKPHMLKSREDLDISALKYLVRTPYYWTRVLPKLECEISCTRIYDRSLWLYKMNDPPVATLEWKMDMASSLISRRELTKGEPLTLNELERCVYDVEGWVRSIKEDRELRDNPDPYSIASLACDELAHHMPRSENHQIILARILGMKSYNKLHFIQIMERGRFLSKSK